MKNNKVVKLIIILLVVALVILLIILGLLSNVNKNQTYNNSTKVGNSITYEEEQNDYERQIEFENSLTDVLYVRRTLEIFYNSRCKEMYSHVDDSGNYILDDNNTINENIIKLLSKKYIKDNNITASNLNNFIKLYDQAFSLEIIDIKPYIENGLGTYVVHGITVNSDYELIEEFYLYDYIDFNNNTFVIEPIKGTVNDFSKLEVIKNTEEVEDNKLNSIIITNYEQGTSMAERFTRLKRIMLAVPEVAYNYLDKDYREARFGSLDNFKKYVQRNKEEIKKSYATGFLTNALDDGSTELVLKDQFDNMYIFNEKDLLNYTLKLDTYTLTTKKFKEAYEDASNREKVAMNIDKFFQMINANDFRTSYSVLNDGFKNNYFKTEDSFETFMKTYVYSHPNVRYVNFDDSISGIFTYRIEVTNKENEKDSPIVMNIVMQLNEGTDYSLSFEITK